MDVSESGVPLICPVNGLGVNPEGSAGEMMTFVITPFVVGRMDKNVPIVP